MNLLHLLRFIPKVIFEGVFGILIIICSTLSLIFILPFCRKENTIDAGYKWFAWHPVFVGNRYDFRVEDFRWLTFVGRREYSFGLIIYEDLGE